MVYWRHVELIARGTVRVEADDRIRTTSGWGAQQLSHQRPMPGIAGTARALHVRRFLSSVIRRQKEVSWQSGGEEADSSS